MSLRLRSLFLIVPAALLVVAPVSLAENSSQSSQNGLFPEEIVSAEDLHKEMEGPDKPLLLDARNQKGYEAEHIQGAELPRGDEFFRQVELFRTGMAPSNPDGDKALAEWSQNIPKDRAIVTYCNSSCHASAALALSLKKLGFTRVRSMEEGIQEWEKKGFPVVKKGA